MGSHVGLDPDLSVFRLVETLAECLVQLDLRLNSLVDDRSVSPDIRTNDQSMRRELRLFGKSIQIIN